MLQGTAVHLQNISTALTQKVCYMRCAESAIPGYPSLTCMEPLSDEWQFLKDLELRRR
jgi:hypothetical protein